MSRFNPELYRIVISTPSTRTPSILYSSPDRHESLNTGHLASHGRFVRHAFFQSCSPTHVADVLGYCPNIENVALRGIRGNCRQVILPLFEELGKRGKLKHLTICLHHFFLHKNVEHGNIIPFASPAFSNVTHLLLGGSLRAEIDWSQISHMPHLSHVALRAFQSPTNTLIDNVLNLCKQLTLLILLDMMSSWSPYSGSDCLEPFVAKNPWLKDGRIVVLIADDLPEKTWVWSSDQWQRSAKGEANFWSIAEEKQAKKLQDGSYLQ